MSKRPCVGAIRSHVLMMVLMAGFNGAISALAPMTPTTLGTGGRMACSAAAAVVATTVTHPLDVVRVRLQVDESCVTDECLVDQKGLGVQKANMLSTARVIYMQGGVGGLYAGLQAGVVRQLTYGMPRMALFSIGLAHLAKSSPDGSTVSFGTKLLLGSASGGIAACIGVPTEVSLVRMAADARESNPEQRRNYKGLVDCLLRIAKTEGIGTLWVGVGMTVARAMLLNAGQLAVYSDAKLRLGALYLSQFGQVPPLIPLMFVSAFCGALAAVALSCPADVLKSRVQNACGQDEDQCDIDGNLMVAAGTTPSAMAIARELYTNEGPRAFYKGAGPAVAKIAPHTVISFIILDSLTKYFTGAPAM